MSYFPARRSIHPADPYPVRLTGRTEDVEKATNGAQAAGSNDSFTTPEANNLDVEYPIVCP